MRDTVWLLFLLSLVACGVRPLSKQIEYPELSAHRGAMSVAPGNSSGAISEALRLGAEYIEVDVRRTSQGAFYLFHDKELTKDNNCSQLSTPFDSLTDLEASGLKHPDCSSQVLLLREGLELIKDSPAFVQLDLKGSVVKHLDSLCNQLNIPRDRVIIQLYNIEDVRLVREHCPGVKLLFRVSRREQLGEALKAKPYILQVDEELLPELATQRRVLVKSLSENDRPEIWQRLFKAGATIIMSDRTQDFIRWRRMKSWSVDP